jgi:hypothetical protein
MKKLSAFLVPVGVYMGEPLAVLPAKNFDSCFKSGTLGGMRIALPGRVAVIDRAGRNYEVKRLTRQTGKIE